VIKSDNRETIVGNGYSLLCQRGHLLGVGVEDEKTIFETRECKYCGSKVVPLNENGVLFFTSLKFSGECDTILCMNLGNNHQWHEKIKIYELSDEIKTLFG